MLCVCRVLDGAEAMCVVSELIDSCSVLDESHGLSLLNETQYESLLQCLQCWQRHYCSDESSSKVNTDTHDTPKNYTQLLVFLSVQCYAWTEYKVTCVCLSVCVCPSHFLSTRLQVRPLNGFLVDSFKDVDLRKDVPFGGLDDE